MTEHTALDFWDGPMGWTLMSVGQIVLVMIVLLFAVVYLIYADRKIYAAVGLRRGPNVVGAFGLLQNFADALKFVFKEFLIPSSANKAVFVLAPILSVTTAFAAWAVIPFGPDWAIADINVGILYIFAISSMGVFGVILGGWSSNSKYPFFGSLRSTAQMISYEVAIGFAIVTVIILAESANMQEIIRLQSGGFWNWNVFGGPGLEFLPLTLVMVPMMVIFFVCALAETNRPPFDLPEAESELVAGYQTEYSSTGFLMYYLAETVNIILMCALISILFFGGWQAPFPTPFLENWSTTSTNLFGLFWLSFKIVFFFFVFALVRTVVPRYRYDQLMRLSWKVFLPATLAGVVLVAGWKIYVLNA